LDSHFLLCRCIVTYSYYILAWYNSGPLYVSQTDIYVLLKIMGNHACWFLAWVLRSYDIFPIYASSVSNWAFLT
jgi:hypothetical protein